MSTDMVGLEAYILDHQYYYIHVRTHCSMLSIDQCPSQTRALKAIEAKYTCYSYSVNPLSTLSMNGSSAVLSFLCTDIDFHYIVLSYNRLIHIVAQ